MECRKSACGGRPAVQIVRRMQDMKKLLRVVTASLVLCAVSTGPLRADSLWSGNGTVFRLQASGSNRSFVVERAAKPAAALGVVAGMVVFRGKRDANAYVGTFFDPAKGCAPEGRAVRGRVAGELSVVLEPQPQQGCTGAFGDRLDLRFLGKAGIALPPETPVAATPEAKAEQPQTAAVAAEPEAVADTPQAKPAKKPAAKAKAASPGIPATACHAKAVPAGLTMASCQGLLAGLRLAEGADATSEAARAAAVASGSGLSGLARAVDARCYADAALGDYDAGMAATVTGLASAQDLGRLCLDMVDAAHRVPATVHLAATLPAMGPVEGTVWTLEPEGGSCRGKTVLRLTRAGLFQGRYGAEQAAENSVVSDWVESGDGISATISVYSEIVTAADVILKVAAKRNGDALELRVERARVTPQSRYSNTPVYEGDTVASLYHRCEP